MTTPPSPSRRRDDRWVPGMVAFAVLASAVAIGVVMAPAATAGDGAATAAAAPGADPTTAADDTSTDGPLIDPYRAQQWYVDRIGLGGPVRLPTGRGEVVAVVDSGVDMQHPDLVGSLLVDDDGVVVGRDFVAGDDVPDDEFGHGTMVAGIIAATSGNGVGIRGVAPEARIMPLKVLDATGAGETIHVAEAIDFAVANGATIVNLSLEASDAVDVDDVPEVLAAVEAAMAHDIVVVAAAGNRGEPLSDFAPELGVVVVGATTRDDVRAGFSDRGRTDLVMAPGAEIVSTWCLGEGADTCDGSVHNYGVADGTSFAAPQVSGLVALLRSAGLSGRQAAARLAGTAHDLGPAGPDPDTGVGLVDIRAALDGWPDEPIPLSTMQPLPAPASTVVPADSVPEPTIVAARPGSGGVITWIVAALALGVVVAAASGWVVVRRMRTAPMVPDLRSIAARPRGQDEDAVD